MAPVLSETVTSIRPVENCADDGVANAIIAIAATSNRAKRNFIQPSQVSKRTTGPENSTRGKRRLQAPHRVGLPLFSTTYRHRCSNSSGILNTDTPNARIRTPDLFVTSTWLLNEKGLGSSGSEAL